MKDNRKLQRFLLAVESRCILNNKGSVREVSAQTRDISAAGAFLISDDLNISVGTEVRVEMKLSLERLRSILKSSDNVVLFADGQVTRAEKDGVAVSFTNRLRFAGEQTSAGV